MIDDALEFEKKYKKLYLENNKLLEIFKEDLNGLTDKVIKSHIDDVDLFINDYLASYYLMSPIEGISMLTAFIEDFFIRKCMWSTPRTIKTTVSSIRLFYKSMLNHEIIDEEDYENLTMEIKEEMTSWQETCRSASEI